MRAICLFGLVLLSLAEPVFGQVTEEKKREIVATVQSQTAGTDYLDTLDVSAVVISPDIGRYFRRDEAFSKDDNPYDRFISDSAIARGRQFYQTNHELLTMAEDRFGPPAEVFVAILHVESNFGHNTETHQVLGVLVSMIYYLDTADWKYDPSAQLAVLPKVAQAVGVNPVNLRGSYAGAIGIPQFVPTSFQQFGADGNGDGRVDLSDIADAIYSIGNYLKAAGWSKSSRDALRAYNDSQLYVDCILTYTDKLKHHNSQ
jgi:membrane-bound lytic murein transglycosylase B